MTTSDLQTEIKRLLKQMNWSQDRAALTVFCEEHPDDDDEQRQRQFSEAFRKKLNRPRTSPDWLRKVLRILSDQPETKRATLSIPPEGPPILPEAVRRAVQEAGQTMARKLIDADAEA